MFWKVSALGKISKIGIVPPRPEPDREGVAVALIVRNEARHIGEWAAFNEVYRGFFAPPYPARSAFGTSGLALGARVEVECIAVRSAPPTGDSAATRP